MTMSAILHKLTTIIYTQHCSTFTLTFQRFYLKTKIKIIMLPIPVIAIVGRPNVGKSTLFNRLTRTRQALVSDISGLTRDRQYGIATYQNKNFIVIDTGGIDEHEGTKTNIAKANIAIANAQDPIAKLVAKQSWQAVIEADIIFFIVDARSGLTPIDSVIAEKLRKISSNKRIFFVINKIDGIKQVNITATTGDFYELGLTMPFMISAEHGDGVRNLLDAALLQPATLTPPQPPPLPIPIANTNIKANASEASAQANAAATVTATTNIEANEQHIDDRIKVAFIGHPNVGKSTLVNRILGEDRVIVSAEAGTTRDSIFINFTRRNKPYTLIDTAGIRRRGRVNDKIEKFSVIKSLQAIQACNVVVLLLDAQTNVTEQDLHLLGFALDSGRALIIAVNKWDGLSTFERQRTRDSLDRRLTFVDFAPIHFISALHGTGVGDLFPIIEKVYAAATKKVKTSVATRILIQAVTDFPPPLAHGKRIKLRYAHVGGHNPPIIVIHGNQTESLPASYCKYLEREFRRKLKLFGTPIRLVLKTSENPYDRNTNKK